MPRPAFLPGMISFLAPILYWVEVAREEDTHSSETSFCTHHLKGVLTEEQQACMCSLVTPGQAGPEVAGIINPVAIAALSVHLPLRDLQQSYIMPFASRSRASCSPGRHVGHPSPLSSTTFCSPLIRVNYNRGQHIFQDSLFSSWCFKSAGPAPCPHNLSERDSLTR